MFLKHQYKQIKNQSQNKKYNPSLFISLFLIHLTKTTINTCSLINLSSSINYVLAFFKDVNVIFAPNPDSLISKSNESYRLKTSTTNNLVINTIKSFPAHCLFPTVGLSVSGPLDHITYFNNASPSPTNLSGTNSSGRSNTFGSLVANGWYPNNISPFLTWKVASCDSMVKSHLAFAYCGGTGGSMRRIS